MKSLQQLDKIIDSHIFIQPPSATSELKMRTVFMDLSNPVLLSMSIPLRKILYYLIVFRFSFRIRGMREEKTHFKTIIIITSSDEGELR